MANTRRTRVRRIDIAVASYVAVGIAIIHATLYGFFFSAVSGFLVFGLLIYERKSIHKFKQYDSWGWSKTATIGLLVGVVIISLGGFPLWQELVCPYLGEQELLTTFYWKLVELVFLGMLMAVSVYFRGYLQPVEAKTNWRLLEWEHREWLGLFQIGAVFAGVAFIGSGYSYVTGLIENVSLSSQGKIAALMPAIQLLYVAGGYLIWILRPWYGRLKEIRDHLNRLKQAEKASKQPGTKEET